MPAAMTKERGDNNRFSAFGFRVFALRISRIGSNDMLHRLLPQAPPVLQGLDGVLTPVHERWRLGRLNIFGQVEYRNSHLSRTLQRMSHTPEPTTPIKGPLVL